MEFKKLELEPELNPVKRMLKSEQLKRIVLPTVIGGTLSLLYFYFTEGKQMDTITIGQLIKSFAIGALFGYFITNSPCARGRC